MVYNKSKALYLKGSLMKKLSVLLGIIILSSGISYAAINEDRTSDIDLLRNQGFSESTLQVVDTAKFHDSNGRSNRYFKKSKNKFGRGYSAIKTYIDPVQDDGLFGEHQIHFSNSWDFGRNNYAVRRNNTSKEVDNL